MCENLHYKSVYFKELHNVARVLLTDNIQSGGSCSVNYYQFYHVWLRACLHEDGGPQVGEITRLGGVTRLSI